MTKSTHSFLTPEKIINLFTAACRGDAGVELEGFTTVRKAVGEHGLPIPLQVEVTYRKPEWEGLFIDSNKLQQVHQENTNYGWWVGTDAKGVFYRTNVLVDSGLLNISKTLRNFDIAYDFIQRQKRRA